MTRVDYLVKDLTFSDAKYLTEMILILNDIEHALGALRIIVERYLLSQDRDDVAIRLSLFRDSIVQFVGCFGKDRFKLDKDQVYNSIGGPGEYFQWLQDLRDTFAAHSFGSSRQCLYSVFVDNGGEIKGFGRQSVVYLGPDPLEYAKIGSFISISYKYVEVEIEKYTTKVENITKNMSPQELLSLPQAKIVVPGPEDLRTSRANFKSGKTSNKR